MYTYLWIMLKILKGYELPENDLIYIMSYMIRLNGR
jgi:hypothetical protein